MSGHRGMRAKLRHDDGTDADLRSNLGDDGVTERPSKTTVNVLVKWRQSKLGQVVVSARLLDGWHTDRRELEAMRQVNALCELCLRFCCAGENDLCL
jgi:hypothetical protein